MSVNQQAIAKRLNVSVATVSRSLKNDLSISAQTRAMVLETAQKLGYNTPTAFRSRAVKAGKQIHDGMLPVCALIQSDAVAGMEEYENSLVPGIIAGMSNAASQFDSSLIVHYVPLEYREKAADNEMLPRMVRDGMVSGIVLIHYYPEHVVKKLAEEFVCVSINNDYGLPNVDHTSSNQTGAMIQLAKGVYQKGHRKIGYIGKIDTFSWSKVRFAAYVEAIINHGLAFNPDLVFDLSKSEIDRSLIENIKKQMNNGLSAIMCANDSTGYALMRELNKAGIRVPEDISLTGFDCVPVPSGLTKLQSVKLPCPNLGFSAVELVHSRISYPSAPAKHILYDAVIVNGKSVSVK